ncbi:phosphatidate phosphatase [Starmerella bacillaris]|uniref:Phosphatidate phosphatase n=1 Tax=Starmerella bacillaris TaxID=1247836 RepID=A0AAV5RQ78_STABA|nr:phosphatidate phosphatase [Starmerella bacillaris]
MQYFERAIGTVSRTWNSINPATLSGAIDVVVIKVSNGDYHCSAFHIRFGKISLLQPSQKGVDFYVNDKKINLKMKLGDGGEAFFVFETDADDVPEGMLTSPVISPSASPNATTNGSVNSDNEDVEYLDISNVPENESGAEETAPLGNPDQDPLSTTGDSKEDSELNTDMSNSSNAIASSPDMLPEGIEVDSLEPMLRYKHPEKIDKIIKQLRKVKIPHNQDTDGNVIMDMTGYKAGGENSKELEKVVQNIMTSNDESPSTSTPNSPKQDDSSESDYDHSHDPTTFQARKYKEDYDTDSGAERYKTPEPQFPLRSGSRLPEINDIDNEADSTIDYSTAKSRNDINDSKYGSVDESNKQSSDTQSSDNVASGESKSSSTTKNNDGRQFVKTLRLSSDILKSLDLKPGSNDMRFVVRSNNATVTANIFLWDSEVPVVISDIDGTITKSDAMGHLMTLVGRDWTHAGVGRLFSDISANGYNIMYLTSRSVGLADTTRGYLKSIHQNGYSLPSGPVILSPDRTMAALRREVILRKPEVFKMACLRDIAKLYEHDFDSHSTPFYAGFGNRITDAISYRSVGVPSTKIFTINKESEVRMELLELTGIKSSYILITDLVDQLFPPVHTEINKLFDLNSQEFSDTKYWKQPLPELSDDDDDTNDAGEAIESVFNAPDGTELNGLLPTSKLKSKYSHSNVLRDDEDKDLSYSDSDSHDYSEESGSDLSGDSESENLNESDYSDSDGHFEHSEESYLSEGGETHDELDGDDDADAIDGDAYRRSDYASVE